MKATCKVAPMANTNDSVIQDNLQRLFTRFASFWKYAGLYCPLDQTNRRKRNLRILYTVFIQTVAAMNLRYAMMFENMTKLSGSLMFGVCFFVITMGYVCRSFLVLFAAHNKFPKYLDLFRLYYDRYRHMSYVAGLNKGLVFMMVFTFLQGLIYVFANFVSQFVGSGIPMKHLAPCDRYTDWKFWACYPIVILPIIVVLCMDVCGTSFCSSTIFMLAKEYTRVSEDLKKLVLEKVSDPEMNIAETFEALRKRHQELCTLLDTANSFLQHIFFTMYASCIPATCVVLYSAIHSSGIQAETIIAWAIVLAVTFGMALLTISGAWVHVKAHQPYQTLAVMDMTKLSVVEFQTFQVFLSYLQRGDIGFSIYGMFTVTPNTILMLLGTLLTYVVVALQIQ